MLVRLLVIALLLGSTVSLHARGRARGYQAGGGVHRAQPRQRAKRPKDKQPKKPTPPAEIKADLSKPSN